MNVENLTLPERIYAPWTEEQVEILQKYQDNLNVHPYTCTCGESLIPTVKGWECEACTYTQDCFWEMSLSMADYENPLSKLIEENPNP